MRKTDPIIGAARKVTRFLFMPTRKQVIGKRGVTMFETRWLERASWHQYWRQARESGANGHWADGSVWVSNE